VLGGASIGAFVSLRFFQAMAHVTNALVAHDRAGVSAGLFAAGLFIALSIGESGLSQLFQYLLRIRIRTALTIDLLRRWLGGRNFYQPGQEGAPDHPEQRVQEDIFNFCLSLTTLVPPLVGAFTSIWLYSGQLWALSDEVSVTLPFSGGLVVPKGLYVLAIGMAVVATILIHLIGRIVTRLEVVRQRLEAGFRHDLGQAREFAEQIVLGNGQAVEGARARHDYGLIRRNWTPFAITSAILHGCIVASGLLKVLVPNIILVPLVLEGKMQVGDLAIAVLAFGVVYQTFASGATFYESFMPLRSAVQRIGMLDRSLAHDQPSGFTMTKNDHAAFMADGLDVQSVSGRDLFSLGKLKIGAGERWLVRGISGSGKSTFFRVMAGVWPFGGGKIARPPASSAVMFLPQKPYLPDGTLGELLSYPGDSSKFSSEDYQAALRDVCLERLTGQIDVSRAWAKSLSPGEQQRVVLARALLQRPDFLFLDEATSSLDPKTEAVVFDALIARLPETAIVTIAHTDRLSGHYHHLLSIEDGRATATDLQIGTDFQDEKNDNA
jgi:putative ATP-binding cassette transporter